MLRELRDERVSIRDAAREAAMSPFHFIRRFQAMFGETPHQVRMRAQLESSSPASWSTTRTRR
jgi:AraC-like DNA-binding protein